MTDTNVITKIRRLSVVKHLTLQLKLIEHGRQINESSGMGPTCACWPEYVQTRPQTHADEM